MIICYWLKKLILSIKEIIWGRYLGYDKSFEEFFFFGFLNSDFWIFL